MNAMPATKWGHDAFTDAMWAAGFEPHALGLAMYELYVKTSTIRQDQMEATDFITAGGSYRWGSRIRRIESTRRNRDITIRVKRHSGMKTEAGKLHNVDLYLYAWVEDKLEEFIVFAVKPLLESGLIEDAKVISNYDRSSDFCVIPVCEIQSIPNCLLAGRSSIGDPVSFRWVPSNEYIASKDARTK